ncbi:MAG: phosphoribosylformylglycinamidine synthase subunit PurQ, partial [Candidatus Nitrosotenuis sp.]
ATLDSLKKNNQIVFRYGENINDSVFGIAGICNKEGNVVGMMPHPERAVEADINPKDSKPSNLIFESLIATVGARR